MPWQILFLREFNEDLDELGRSSGVDIVRFREHVLSEFTDQFKGARLDKFLTSA